MGGPGRVPWEVVFGVHPVREVLRVGKRRIRDLWTARSPRDAAIREILALARERGVAVHPVSKEEVERRAPRRGHQGVAIRVEPLETPVLAEALEVLPRGEGTIWVGLDGITDPHNLGAILRNAACFGAGAVLLPDRRSAGLTPLVQKIASGAAEHVPVVAAGNLNQAVRRLQEEGFRVYGAAPEGKPVGEVRIHTPALLLIGSEGRGLRRRTRELTDELVAVPQAPGGVASLNASCALAVLLHEFRRRRGGP